MTNQWLDTLKEEESKHNTAAALRVKAKPGVSGPAEKPKTPETVPSKTSKTISREEKTSRNAQTSASKTSETLKAADHLGIVATWSREFGFTSIHDPFTGEWWDLPTRDAPDWAIREARKRRELYKGGNRKAYRLTAREMSEVWVAEHPDTEGEGIVEDHPVEEDADFSR